MSDEAVDTEILDRLQSQVFDSQSGDDGDATDLGTALARAAPDEILRALDDVVDEQFDAVFDALRAGEMSVDEAESQLRRTKSAWIAQLSDTLDSDQSPAGEDAGQDTRETEVADATERFAYEDALPMATRLVEALPMPAFVLAPDHTLIAYNYGTQQLLGIDSTDALGEDYRDTLGYAVYADGRREMSLADKVVESSQSADVVYDVDRVDQTMLYTEEYVYEDRSTMVNARGEEIPIAFVATPLFEDGELVAVLELFDERESEMEEYPGLAGVLSHDIRNPLSVLKTYTKLAEDELDDSIYEPMRSNIERIEHIIDEVLTLTGEADEDPDRERLDVSEIARQAWNHIETADATLETEPVDVEADSRQLTQALENLLRNAVEHGSTSHADADESADAVEHGVSDEPSVADAPEDAVEHGSTSHADADASADAVEHGGEEVTVRVGPTDDGFYVADDGPGIPEADRERVFEHGYSSRTDGTGYGLPIVHKIVRGHGWFVEVTESDAGGARFEIQTVTTSD